MSFAKLKFYALNEFEIVQKEQIGQGMIPLSDLFCSFRTSF